MNYKFWTLVFSVGISGLSQGMLLPVIAIIIEGEGISSTLNGVHATALYFGVLLISPFLEKPMRKYGYKPIIVIGGFIVLASLLCFPLWKSLYFWFVLRLLVGIGDHMLHFGTQTWITSSEQPHNLGKKLSIYGLSFGVGFMVGPLLANLLEIHISLPFIVSGVISILAWSLILLLKNEIPTALEDTKENTQINRYKSVFIIGWACLIAPFGYGILEASINSSFPVYAIRMGYSVDEISILIPAVSLGGIITQFPLGSLADKIGGKKVVPSVILLGSVLFFVTSFFEDNYYLLWVSLLLVGMVIGSIFSLGLKYMSEILPYELLPTSNMLFGVFFSVGSILGPIIGGNIIENFKGISFFTVQGFIFLSCALLIISFEYRNAKSKKLLT
ncbi:MAG: transporter [Bacillales bacterium]|jgi:MFS family permease|nr:transporter [Bacillales bacterium]